MFGLPVYGSPQNATHQGVFPSSLDGELFFEVSTILCSITRVVDTFSINLIKPSVNIPVQTTPGSYVILTGSLISPIFQIRSTNEFYRRKIYPNALQMFLTSTFFSETISFTPSDAYYLDGYFGISSGTIETYQYVINLPMSIYEKNPQFFQYPNGLFIANTPGQSDTLAPIITNMTVIPMPIGFTRYFVVRVSIIDDLSGFKMLFFSSGNLGYISSKNLIQGNKNDGVYEIIYDMPMGTFELYHVVDMAKNYNSYGPSARTNDPLKKVPIANPSPYFSYQNSQFTAASWSHNDIDVSNSSYSTKFMFNMTNPNKQWSPTLSFLEFGANYGGVSTFYGTWNETSQQYEVVVTIPLRTFTSTLKYNLSQFLNVLFPSSVLRIFSNDADMFGPEIIDLYQLPGQVATVTTGGGDITIGWQFKVYDRLNGFESGNITVVSNRDLAEYTFDLDPNISIQEISIKINEKCLSQTYSISNIYLRDKGGYVSDINNAFINYVDLNFQMINVTCPTNSIDVDSPILETFDFTPKTIDSGSKTRTVVFTFTTTDKDLANSGDGINEQVLPTIYLTSTNEIIKKKANLISFVSGVASYTCAFELPYGFGYPDAVLVSVYGIVDNAGFFAGYAAIDLFYSSFPFFIDTSSSFTPSPFIESTADITTEGGKLMIMGKAFYSNLVAKVTLNYGNEGDAPTQITDPIFSTSSVLVINGVRPTTLPFYIQVKFGSLLSNIYKVIPKPAPVYPPSVSPASSSSSIQSSSSSEENLPPTQTPVQPSNPCLNDCGGSSQGYCSPTGCICYSPWMGIDCKSKV
ncbi:hypothetical protein CYY_010055, partial [Polysphondylium violaceum]